MYCANEMHQELMTFSQQLHKNNEKNHYGKGISKDLQKKLRKSPYKIKSCNKNISHSIKCNKKTWALQMRENTFTENIILCIFYILIYFYIRIAK